MGQREALARGADELAPELVLVGEGDGVDEDVQLPVLLLPLGEDALDVLVLWTSQGSTKVDPSRAASGLTRFSMSISTDEKPTSAPSRWSAWAMPQAIEWSLASPKIRARLPSSRPICVAYLPVTSPATLLADVPWRPKDAPDGGAGACEPAPRPLDQPFRATTPGRTGGSGSTPPNRRMRSTFEGSLIGDARKP